LVELKVEILLPLYYNSSNPKKRKKIEGKKYSETYNEIFKQFGGCTMDNSPLIGGWLDPETNKEIRDETKTYWVVCKNTKSNLEFLRKMKKKLIRRFEQKEIMMYYVRIHRL